MTFTKWAILATLATVCGPLGIVAVQAQDSLAPAQSPAQDGDTEMMARVRQALHDDPGLFDRHIELSTRNGKVLLRGFVGSGEDMVRALKDARHAVGGKNVVNELQIKPEDNSINNPRH